MLVSPLIGVVVWPVMLAWIGLVCYGVVTRLRWVSFFRRQRGRDVPKGVVATSSLLMFVEFAAWAYVLVEITLPWRRRKW